MERSLRDVDGAVGSIVPASIDFTGNDLTVRIGKIDVQRSDATAFSSDHELVDRSAGSIRDGISRGCSVGDIHGCGTVIADGDVSITDVRLHQLYLAAVEVIGAGSPGVSANGKPVIHPHRAAGLIHRSPAEAASNEAALMGCSQRCAGFHQGTRTTDVQGSDSIASNDDPVVRQQLSARIDIHRSRRTNLIANDRRPASVGADRGA